MPPLLLLVLLQPWAKRFKQLGALITQLQQQQAGCNNVAASTADAAPEEPSQPLLAVVGLEGNKLELHVSGLQRLQLAAYQIDTELLFTTQPFSALNELSSSNAPAPLGPRHSATRTNSVAGADGGLGRVSYVQPTAKVQLQLVQAGTAADAAMPTVESVQCTPVGVGSGGSSCSSVQECVLDLDALMPRLKHTSVLLEVTAGGLTRTVPR